ncbi:response regulator [Limimaricola pyoseonensis]|uniref:Response regulator receiver domain-containing protein n=1 Tax=Limimaricola pyoseonensis TaxID=521013 RepID=A0A1G7CIL7_9RHOB|nr:response regulator [Limimaricola pyoseonensis]SDE38580.1 Response regulator receiver domain-containing protein [Limimaricola pyoseonensis]
MPMIDPFPQAPAATAERPLLGLTVLLVEDSRFASEAMRLLCLRSGARIRRAGSLHNARRHLRVYRPNVVIADLGLPDGSGIELIVELGQARPRVEVLLAISGHPESEAPALGAGADGFIAKPIARLAEFQTAVLRHLPAERRPGGPRPLPEDEIAPDRVALRDDLALAAQLMGAEWPADRDIAYVAQFLTGVARSAGDAPLAAAVERLAAARREGAAGLPALARLAALVDERLAAPTPL